MAGHDRGCRGPFRCPCYLDLRHHRQDKNRIAQSPIWPKNDMGNPCLVSSQKSQIPQLASLKFDNSNMVITKFDLQSNMFYVPPLLDNVSLCHSFITKVYAISCLQLLVNVIITSLFYFVPEANDETV